MCMGLFKYIIFALDLSVLVMLFLSLHILYSFIHLFYNFTTYLTLTGSTRVSRYQKIKTNLDLLEQEIVSGSCISYAICKSASRSKQMTTQAPHHSVFLQAGCPSCCPTNSVKALSLASVKSRLVLPFWYRLTRVVPDKIQRAVKWCCVCVHACVRVCVCVVVVTDYKAQFQKLAPHLYSYMCMAFLPSTIVEIFVCTMYRHLETERRVNMSSADQPEV